MARISHKDYAEQIVSLTRSTFGAKIAWQANSLTALRTEHVLRRGKSREDLREDHGAGPLNPYMWYPFEWK